MFFKSAETPPAPLPRNDGLVSDRVHMLRQVVERAQVLLKAQIASERACDARGAMEPGSSRARLTTANARWMRAAEDRDRCERNLIFALAAAGFITEETTT